MPDEDHRAVLRGDRALRDCHVVRKRDGRILDNRDRIAILLERFVVPIQPDPSTKPPCTSTMFLTVIEVFVCAIRSFPILNMIVMIASALIRVLALVAIALCFIELSYLESA